MSNEDLQSWYRAAYPDDDATHDDFWLLTGFSEGLDQIGMKHADVFDALVYSNAGPQLAHANAMSLRRFARAYEKGVQMRTQVIS